MPKRKFAWAEMAPGALVSALVLLAFWLQWGESLELKLYDLRAGLRAASKPAESMVLVVIDERSRAELGAWPWPRSHIADMVEQLSAAGAKVIGLDVFYADREINPALQEVRGLKQALARSGLAKPLAQVLEESEKRLDNDARLVRSLAQGGESGAGETDGLTGRTPPRNQTWWYAQRIGCRYLARPGRRQP